jgi:hypothetical protein
MTSPGDYLGTDTLHLCQVSVLNPTKPKLVNAQHYTERHLPPVYVVPGIYHCAIKRITLTRRVRTRVRSTPAGCVLRMHVQVVSPT